MRHDLGNMTVEETQDLMREVMGMLNDQQIADVLTDTLTSEQKGELIVAWGNEED